MIQAGNRDNRASDHDPVSGEFPSGSQTRQSHELLLVYAAALQRLHAETTQRERRIRLMERSRSWRFTAPFRALRAAAGKLPGIDWIVSLMAPPLPDSSINVFVPMPQLPEFPQVPTRTLRKRSPHTGHQTDERDLSASARLLMTRTHVRFPNPGSI